MKDVQEEVYPDPEPIPSTFCVDSVAGKVLACAREKLSSTTKVQKCCPFGKDLKYPLLSGCVQSDLNQGVRKNNETCIKSAFFSLQKYVFLSFCDEKKYIGNIVKRCKIVWIISPFFVKQNILILPGEFFIKEEPLRGFL